MAKTRFVSYLRVSTVRQGTSGLGLEAQRAAGAGFLNGGDWTLVQEVLEVESGKRNDRPALATALKLCRKHRATLVIAKLDRLARNVAFISNLMESGVEFLAVDMPQANRFVVHILAAVAEQEAEAISKRTKAALAAAKARGTKLGGRRVSAERFAEIGAAARQARSQKTSQVRAELVPTITAIQATGASSLRAIAAELNAREIDPNAPKAWGMVGGPGSESDGRIRQLERFSKILKRFAMQSSEYRPLTDREREVLVWLLDHGPEDATNFLPQLNLIEARSSCSCGCPSIEFSVPVDAPFIHSPQGMRLFAEGHTGTDEVGLMLTAGSGVLSALEVYTYGGVDHAFGLPLLDTLRRSS